MFSYYESSDGSERSGPLVTMEMFESDSEEEEDDDEDDDDDDDEDDEEEEEEDDDDCDSDDDVTMASNYESSDGSECSGPLDYVTMEELTEMSESDFEHIDNNGNDENYYKSDDDGDDDSNSPTIAKTARRDGPSPYQSFKSVFDNFTSYHGFASYIVIKGPESFTSLPNDLTQEQVDGLRYVLLTRRRRQILNGMEELLRGDQNGHGIVVLGASFCYHVKCYWRIVKYMFDNSRQVSQKLDLLFAFTRSLWKYNVWMYRNDGTMSDVVEGLAGVWRDLLRRSDKELGWDTEYSKPGMLEMLRDFKGDVESIDPECGLGNFNYA